MPELRAIGWRRTADLPFPFDDVRGRLFTVNGRAAIFNGLRRLGVGEGDRVLLPAYCCGSEVDAVLRTGASPLFYRMGPALAPDLDHCRTLAGQGARAMLVTHYLGFPQDLAPIAEFARAAGLHLVEDCAHALFAEGVGRTGKLAIFSFVKSLPLPDGGAAVFNGSADVTGPALRAPPLRRAARRTAYLARAGLARSRPALRPALLGRPRSEGDGRPMDQAAEAAILALPEEQESLGMSGLARWLAGHLPLHTVAARRRENYRLLAAQLERARGIAPLFPSLPSAAVPLGLPVVTDDVAGFQRRLAAAGIGSKAFWSLFHPALPRGEFPDEARLKRSVLMLPVHQDLDHGQIRLVAEAICKGPS
jgi:dTDP-4-amino-4,6-dideoxygalactose transaminase